MSDYNSFDDNASGLNSVLMDLFDPEWYKDKYSDLYGIDREDLFRHYMLYGIYENRSPSVLFSSEEFVKINNLDSEQSFISFIIYIQSLNNRHLKPNIVFDVLHYRNQLNARNINAKEPVSHYKKFGWRENLNPHPLFDTAYYLRHNKIELQPNQDPLTHFLNIGIQKNFSTSPFFDNDFYLKGNEDVLKNGRHPLIHYLTYGCQEGRIPNALLENLPPQDKDSYKIKADANNRDFLSQLISDEYFQVADLPFGISSNEEKGLYLDYRSSLALSDAPYVSIIIANCNGAPYLSDLLRSIKAQTYKNFEIILVDDCSSDESISIAESFGCRVIKNDKRRGFTGCNNIGQTISRGELIALINNDTVVSEEWLESLVIRMKTQNNIGAVCSKIRFKERFVNISLVSSNFFSIDFNSLRYQLMYKKFFVRWGILKQDYSFESSQYGDSEYRIEFDVAVEDREYELHIISNNNLKSGVKIFANSVELKYNIKMIDEGKFNINFNISDLDIINKFFIINNAGSMSGPTGIPFDRGFGEKDCGQYNSVCDVDYLCGCSALIRRDALEGKTLFIEEFFAYFEDSELSYRLKKSGYKIAYEPSSVVYHYHSATTTEKSAFWRRQISRNEVLFNYIVNRPINSDQIESSISHLNHLANWYPTSPDASQDEIMFSKEIPKIIDEIREIKSLIDSNLIPRQAGKRIGLFNPYWTTLGGGEAHALNVAECLAGSGTVDLISTSDFDIFKLAIYFNVDISRIRKRLVTQMTSSITEDYDLFINSCYGDSTVSYAKKSIYIVSFPHKSVSQEFIRSYKFIPNSDYTHKWVKKYWGEVDCTVINPMVASEFFNTDAMQTKEKTILSVGRFASQGHIKNQKEIVKAFKEISTIKGFEDWKLVLIGSVNDNSYLQEVKLEATGYNVEFIINADYNIVIEMYKKASIYVHASGLGRSESEEPELQEHFGMAVAQGVCAGCLPVVFNAAGPAEIVKDFGFGETFSSEQEMSEAISRSILLIQNGLDDFYKDSVAQSCIKYGMKALCGKVENLVNT